MPLLITFLLPLVIVLLLYVTALILYVYRLHRYMYFNLKLKYLGMFLVINFNFYFRHRLRSAYGTDWRNASRNVVAAVWDAHGWIWHGRKNLEMYQEVFKIPLVFFSLSSLFVGFLCNNKYIFFIFISFP